MKVVLLTTRRSQRPAWLLEIKKQLGVAARQDVEVSVVSAHRPARPLPVAQHLLAGSALSLKSRVTPLPVAPDEVDAADSPVGDPGISLEKAAADPIDEHTVTGPIAEHTAINEDAGPTEANERVPAGSVLHLPVYHPRRVAKAASWRANKARITVKRHKMRITVKRQKMGITVNRHKMRLTVKKNSGLARVRSSTQLLKAKTNYPPSSASGSFAVACLRAREVGELVEVADLVVALDIHTHRAAWLLSRRHRKPEVMVSTAAGKQVIDRITAVPPA